MRWWPGKKGLTQAQLWGLAAGGILTQVNDETFGRLAFVSGAEPSRVCLRDWWGVNNADELERMLEWLWSEGHSRGCVSYCDALAELGETDYDDWEPASLVEFALANLDSLRGSQLVAWDLCRLVNVVRWGFTSGYIDEPNSLRWIMRAAIRLQRWFPSWKALGADFVLGYNYWRRMTDASGETAVAPAFNWLLTSVASPWVRLPWNTPLEA